LKKEKRNCCDSRRFHFIFDDWRAFDESLKKEKNFLGV
jgi:hypothetical protein